MAPGPPGSYLLQLPPFLRDPLGFLQGMASKYGDVVCLRRYRTFLLTHPEHIKHVLQDNHTNYQKGPRYKRALRPLMGEGLLTSDGDFWLRQRRLMQPVFSRGHHDFFVRVILDQTEQMCRNWEAAASGWKPLNLRNEIARLTLAIILRIAFGEECSAEMDEVAQAMFTVEHEVNPAAVFLPIRIPEFIPTPSRVRFRRALRTIDGFLYGLIARRRSDGSNRKDVLSLLLPARDESTGESMNDRQIRDELVTMLNAGHETVTDAITWAIILLLRHPTVEAKLREENETVLAARPLSMEDVPKLAYHEMVINEAMRLFPPGWAFVRAPIQDDTIGGYWIPAGSTVVISPYVLHRSAQWWDSPEQFVPERFLPERSASRHRFAYFPFSAGPRQCIGSNLAMLEERMILTILIQKFRFELLDGEAIRPLPRISLKQDREVLARVVPIERAKSPAGAAAHAMHGS